MNDFLKRAWAEVHLDRAEKNLRILTGLLDTEHTKPVCVVKANAYGHGDAELMKLYQGMGIGFFAVSNINEGIKLRENGCSGDIIVLSWSPSDKGSMAAIHSNNLIQAAVSYEHALEMSANSPGEIRVHVKLDTGMGRVGLNAFDTGECAETVKKISEMKNLKAEGIFTHFAAADSLSKDKTDYTGEQKRRFSEVVRKCEDLGVTFIHRHFTNSAGAIIHKDNASTLARLGITLYGLTPEISLPLPEGLQPVMDFKACVSQVKTIHKGQSVSYGRTFIAERDTKVATIPAGYADGYPRLLSGRSEVLVKGRRAKVIGRICMDQMMIDVTDIPGVKMGDICTLIGRDGGETVTADEIAEICGTIGYEIVSGISSRVPRVYY